MAKRSPIMPYVLYKVVERNISKYGSLTCEICEEPINEDKFHYDHIIPVSKFDRKISKGRMNGIKNLQIAHKGCNEEKTNLLPSELVSKNSNETRRAISSSRSHTNRVIEAGMSLLSETPDSSALGYSSS